jgi:hypothetical protein
MAACISPLPHPRLGSPVRPGDMLTMCHITMASIYLGTDD